MQEFYIESENMERHLEEHIEDSLKEEQQDLTYLLKSTVTLLLGLQLKPIVPKLRQLEL